MRACILGVALAMMCGCIDDDFSFDVGPHPEVLTGEDAQKRIPGTPPDSAFDFYVLDTGNFNGTIYYASFSCGTLQDCWTAVAELGAPRADEFENPIRSEYSVNINGPGYYWPELDTDLWRLENGMNGFSYQSAQDTQRMEFWAIDADALRVYYHRESGGFPTDPPDVKIRNPRVDLD